MKPVMHNSILLLESDALCYKPKQHLDKGEKQGSPDALPIEVRRAKTATDSSTQDWLSRARIHEATIMEIQGDNADRTNAQGRCRYYETVLRNRSSNNKFTQDSSAQDPEDRCLFRLLVKKGK